MAFGFSDIGQMFGPGMAQYGQGLDKMRGLPMGQKLMAAGNILHGGVGPADMAGAAYHLGQPAAPGATPGAPGAAPIMPPAAATTAAPAAGGGQNDGSSLFMGLLPMLMKNGMGAGLLGGAGAAAGGSGGGMGGMGGLLGKFGFGG